VFFVIEAHLGNGISNFFVKTINLHTDISPSSWRNDIELFEDFSRNYIIPLYKPKFVVILTMYLCVQYLIGPYDQIKNTIRDVEPCNFVLNVK
jgi:hypothetical protein